MSKPRTVWHSSYSFILTYMCCCVPTNQPTNTSNFLFHSFMLSDLVQSLWMRFMWLWFFFVCFVLLEFFIFFLQVRLIQLLVIKFVVDEQRKKKKRGNQMVGAIFSVDFWWRIGIKLKWRVRHLDHVFCLVSIDFFYCSELL